MTTTIRLDTQRGRAALTPRKAPYYAKIRRGLSLGLRKLDDERGTWTARLFVGPGGNDFEWRLLGDLRQDEGGPGLDYEQARQAAERWAAEVATGVRVRDDAGMVPTVAAACHAYVEARRAEHAQGAHDADMAFRRRVYGFQNPPDAKRAAPEYPAGSIAAVELGKFRAKHLRDWRDAMVKAGVAKSTVNRNLTHLKAALNAAVASKLGPAQLAAEVTLVSPFENATQRRTIFLDKAQRRALLAAAEHAGRPCSNGALCNLIEAAALTGARPGELVGLLRSSFDLRTASLTFSGKTGERTVPLSPAAAKLFTRLAKGKLPNAPLLPRDDGKPWAHSDYDEHIRAAVRRAKLPKGTVMYSLRHSFITEALLSGNIATLEVARLVGTSLAMIEKHYGHLVANRTRESLAAVAML